MLIDLTKLSREKAQIQEELNEEKNDLKIVMLELAKCNAQRRMK
jgi:hypothetical protein